MPAVATPGTVARRLEFTVKGIVYFRYDVQDRVVHEVSAWPPRRVVDGIDQLNGVNQALGY